MQAVCFDVDCTCTTTDSLDLLAEFMGVGRYAAFMPIRCHWSPFACHALSGTTAQRSSGQCCTAGKRVLVHERGRIVFVSVRSIREGLLVAKVVRILLVREGLKASTSLGSLSVQR